MSRWFRFYAEALDDPKVQKLEPSTFKHWVNLLCLAAKNDGVLPSQDDIAFALRIDEIACQSLLDRLLIAGLIDILKGGPNGSRIAPHGWNQRQYKSDVSTDRVKRYRERSRNVSVTPPDTETDTETETEVITPLNPPKGGFPCPEGVDPIDWDSLLKVRQQKRAKMTAGAYRAILKKLEKWQSEGWPPGPIVANAVERGWTTVFETDEMQKGKFHGKKKSIDGSDGLSSTARAAISVFGFDGPDYEHNPGLQNGVSKPTDGLSSFDGSDWDDGGSPF